MSYLGRAGLKLLARNYRCRLGELDLVMQHGVHIVVVEVRARTNRRFATPAQSIDTRKRQRLRNAARHFVMRNPQYHGRAIRFDVICVEEGVLEWIRDAF